jgi:hypothetical protein
LTQKCRGQGSLGNVLHHPWLHKDLVKASGIARRSHFTAGCTFYEVEDQAR